MTAVASAGCWRRRIFSATVAIEPRVVRPIDVAERSSTDVFEDGQRAPFGRQDIERRARDTRGRVDAVAPL